MKYQSTSKIIHIIDFPKAGRYACPECSQNSKRKNPKDLQYYPETKTAYCHKCEITLFEYNPHEKNKVYKAPEWKNITNLTEKAVRWFNGRMIRQETLNKMKVYSDVEYMPQFEKEVDVICFPMFQGEKLINIKFRGPNKSFKLSSGAELIWVNYDALKNFNEIIIVEGEIDLLTWIDNGYENVISVPNGANNNLEYLDSSIGLFDSIDKFYIAVDNDTKGIELRDELIRRLGNEKCFVVNFKQYKDSNEYFCAEGGIAFKELIDNSKQLPVKGIVKIDSFYHDIVDLYENGIKEGCKIDNEELDKYITWELQRLAIVSGVPGSGKSEVVDYIICRLNLLYGWKAAYFTPENWPLQLHYAKLHEKYSGRKFKKSNDPSFDMVYEHVQDNFNYIFEEEDFTFKMIIDSAKNLVKTKGIKILVIDPYNVIEHKYESGETEAKYVSRFLEELRKFARFNSVLVFLVAHPRTLYNGETPSLYSISGGANFYNKADYGIIVEREKDSNAIMTSEVNVYVQKVKFKHLGGQGIAKLRYNYNNGRYETRRADVNHWDNSNWLIESNEVENNWYDYESKDFGSQEEVPF